MGLEDGGPDFAAVAEGLRFALHHSIDKPVQTQEVIARKPLTLASLQARGPLAPALREAIERQLAKLRAQDGIIDV